MKQRAERGVITSIDNKDGVFTIETDSGMLVGVPGNPLLRPGQLIEVQNLSYGGGHQPYIVPAKVRVSRFKRLKAGLRRIGNGVHYALGLPGRAARSMLTPWRSYLALGSGIAICLGLSSLEAPLAFVAAVGCMGLLGLPRREVSVPVDTNVLGEGAPIAGNFLRGDALWSPVTGRRPARVRDLFPTVPGTRALSQLEKLHDEFELQLKEKHDAMQRQVDKAMGGLCK
jgi:hypothetical protein